MTAWLCLQDRYVLETKVCDLYYNENGIKLLLSAFQTAQKNVRLLICRIFDKIAHDIPANVLEIVANDCDSAVRFWLIHWEVRMRSFNPIKASKLRKLLINDASARIRNIMLLASIAAEDDDVYTSLYQSLFDKSSGIREMARYYIKQKTNLDFSSLYRKMLTEKGTRLQIAIAGLGETGVDRDYALILPLLPGSSSQTREGLKALVKLDAPRAFQELLQALADPRSTVRHLALKELPKWLSDEYEGTLLNVWPLAASEEARCCIAKSMLTLSPWRAAHALLQVVKISPFSKEAANALEKWYPSRQKNYAPIPPEVKEKIAIENALTAAAPFLKQSIIDRVLGFI